MLRLGLTGGIASGKSTVAAEFARLGVPVADADVISRELTDPGAAGLKQLVAALGTQFLDTHGELDRVRLRQRLFADAVLRRQVERILHPLVIHQLTDMLGRFQAPYAIAVIPLLAENPEARGLVNRVLVVDCPESLQLARLMSRDGESRESAQAMLTAQADRQRRLAAGDDILMNTGGLAELTSSVARLHQFYLDLAGHPMYLHSATRQP
ncbi:MAG: dephospho-CoA kinase [Gammaproteobacteria bacterium]